MKILKLTAENVKKLRAVEITPTGELVEITGRNGSGKTSVLDSIWWALEGTKHIQAMPIRKGADKARIRLDLGELVVERRFNPKGSILTVESAEGARFTSPQGILDKLLGALTFDPLAFVNQEPREQFESLRRIVPLEVDLDQLDGLSRTDYDKRTEINREAKALRAQADGIAVPDKLPDAPIDTAALKSRMTEASTINAEIEKERGERLQAATKISENIRAQGQRTATAVEKRQRANALDLEAANLRDEAAAIDAEVEQQLEKMGNLREDLDALPALADPVDAGALRAELDAGEAINRGIELRTRKAAILEAAKKAEAEAEKLTGQLEARAKVKADAIAKAPMPVPGLSFGDGIVTYDGVPFDQAETSAQIRVGVAIAMAANPKLKVIRIKEGSFLDEDNLALIAGMAREHDYQVWLERVDTSGKIGIVIEDGQVVAVDGAPVAEPVGKKA